MSQSLNIWKTDSDVKSKIPNNRAVLDRKSSLSREERKGISELLLDAGYKEEADRFVNCGHRLLKLISPPLDYDFETEYQKKIRKLRGQVLQSPFEYGIVETCKSRLCDYCAEKQFGTFYHGALEIVKSLKSDGKRRVSFLTVTFKTQPLTLSYMRSCIKALRRFVNIFYGKWAYRYDKKRGVWVKTKNKINCGALAVMEIGAGGNLHFHLLVYGYYRSIEQMSRTWLSITGDSYRLWINQVSIRTKTAPESAVRYILKYIRKPPRFSNLNLYLDYFVSLRGVRRIHTYGVFYARPEWKKYDREPLECPLTGVPLICVGYAQHNEILLDYHKLTRDAAEGPIRDPVKVDLLLEWTSAQRACKCKVDSPLLRAENSSLDKKGPSFVG
jgi:hypothetical protein